MKREPLPLPGTLQTGAHVRNTPNARRRTGERDGKATVREGSEEGRGADFEADLAMLAAVQAQLERQGSTEEARQWKGLTKWRGGSGTGRLFLWPPLPDRESLSSQSEARFLGKTTLYLCRGQNASQEARGGSGRGARG